MLFCKHDTLVVPDIVGTNVGAVYYKCNRYQTAVGIAALTGHTKCIACSYNVAFAYRYACLLLNHIIGGIGLSYGGVVKKLVGASCGAYNGEVVLQNQIRKVRRYKMWIAHDNGQDAHRLQ